MVTAVQPPPRYIEEFNTIWRDWLFYEYQFVQSHTGGGLPIPPATGTSWNAHGNTATGDDTNHLIVDEGTFQITGAAGTTPDTLDNAGAGFAFIQSKQALRAGGLTNTGAGYWDDGSIGPGSIGLGRNVWPTGQRAIAIGDESYATGDTAIAIGKNCEATGSTGSVAIGLNSKCDGAQSIAIGTGATTDVASSVALSLGSNVDCEGVAPVAIGAYLNSTVDGSVTIGTGVNAVTRMSNTSTDTMWMGVSSTLPTFIMKNNSPGPGSTSFIGIITQDPLSTLDVGGSVGYQQELLVSTDGSTDADETYTATLTFANAAGGVGTITRSGGSAFDTLYSTGSDIEVLNSPGNSWYYYVTGVTATVITVKTLTADGNTFGTVGAGQSGRLYQSVNQSHLTDELVVAIDGNAAVTPPVFIPAWTIHLDSIANIDRRMYHILNDSTAATPSVRIRPDMTAEDEIRKLDGTRAYGDATEFISPGDAVQIVANSTNGNWKVI